MGPAPSGRKRKWLTGTDTDRCPWWPISRRQESDIQQAKEQLERAVKFERLVSKTHPRVSAELKRAAHDGLGEAWLALGWYLAAGLERRVGFEVGELGLGAGLTFQVLSSRIETPDRLNVCRDCEIVFRSKRKGKASQCERCRNNQRLPRGAHWIYDGKTGEVQGWERLSPRTCRDCGRFFVDDCRAGGGRPMIHCRNCSAPAPGRFRFESLSGDPLQAVSFAADPEGRTVYLEASDGVIETNDAEHAYRLRSMGTLRELTDQPAERRSP